MVFVVILFVVVVAALALRYGLDTRPTIQDEPETWFALRRCRTRCPRDPA
jgi:hypothetical protein